MRCGLYITIILLLIGNMHLDSSVDSQQGSQELDFWIESSTRKVMEDECKPPESMHEIEISSGKNEYEAAQLVIRPRKAIKNLQISAGTLAGSGGESISTENIEIRYSTYIYLPMVKKTMPDPLPPLVKLDLEPDKNLPVYIIVRVPVNATAGNYEGSVFMKWDGGEVKTKIRLTVWNFKLPEKPLFTTSFGCSFSLIDKVHGVIDDPGRSHELNNKYYKMLLDYMISPYDIPVPTDSPDASKYYNDPRLTSFVIPYSENDNVLKRTIDILKKNKWWDKGYFYIEDEPISRDKYESLHKKTERLKKFAPDARIIGTVYRRPDFDDTKTPFDVAGQDINLWCLNTGFYAMDADVRKQAHEREKQGDLLWLYVCCGPGEPYCNFFVEMSSMQHRLLFWQHKMSRVSGLLYWNTTHWLDVKNNNQILDPWTNIATFYLADIQKDIYGDGSLLYPGVKVGVDGPVPSIRLLNIRDGIEDYEYLCLLEERYGNEKTEEIVSRLVTSFTEYSRDPKKLDTVRKEIAKLLLR